MFSNTLLDYTNIVETDTLRWTYWWWNNAVNQWGRNICLGKWVTIMMTMMMMMGFWVHQPVAKHTKPQDTSQASHAKTHRHWQVAPPPSTVSPHSPPPPHAWPSVLWTGQYANDKIYRYINTHREIVSRHTMYIMLRIHYYIKMVMMIIIIMKILALGFRGRHIDSFQCSRCTHSIPTTATHTPPKCLFINTTATLCVHYIMQYTSPLHTYII